MKIYEAWFGRANYTKTFNENFWFTTSLAFQDRIPLENTDSTYWGKSSNYDRRTPNYPTELVDENFKRHQALMLSVFINWRPGTRYIEFPLG